MHTSLHMIMVTETDRIRRENAAKARSHSIGRSRFAAIAARVSSRGRDAAHGIPPRADPGTDSLPSVAR